MPSRRILSKALHRKNKRRGARQGAPPGRAAYAIRTRFARGPFGLCSTSNVTRSPPVSESKFSDVSMPERWKKYSFPSSAAMKPNPRSDTTFLIVPWDIKKLPFSNNLPERTGLFEKRSFRDHTRTRPLADAWWIVPEPWASQTFPPTLPSTARGGRGSGQALARAGQGVVEQAAHDAAADPDAHARDQPAAPAQPATGEQVEPDQHQDHRDHEPGQPRHGLPGRLRAGARAGRRPRAAPAAQRARAADRDRGGGHHPVGARLPHDGHRLVLRQVGRGAVAGLRDARRGHVDLHVGVGPGVVDRDGVAVHRGDRAERRVAGSGATGTAAEDGSPTGTSAGRGTRTCARARGRTG